MQAAGRLILQLAFSIGLVTACQGSARSPAANASPPANTSQRHATPPVDLVRRPESRQATERSVGRIGDGRSAGIAVGQIRSARATIARQTVVSRSPTLNLTFTVHPVWEYLGPELTACSSPA